MSCATICNHSGTNWSGRFAELAKSKGSVSELEIKNAVSVLRVLSAIKTLNLVVPAKGKHLPHPASSLCAKANEWIGGMPI